MPTNTGGVVELVDAVDRLHGLAERIRKSPDDEKPGTISELVAGVKELHDLSYPKGQHNGNGELPQTAGLLEFLGTIVTQGEKSSQHIITQLQTQHNNDLARMNKEHDLRMAEQEARLADQRARDREYWDRIDNARKEEEKHRDEFRKEEQTLILDKLAEVNTQATVNLKHAEELITARQESSEALIEARTEFADQIVELKKTSGGDEGTKQLVELAINRIGGPIVSAIEGRTTSGGAAETKPAQSLTGKAPNKGADMFGIGALKKAFVGQFKEYVDGMLDQVVKHIKRWPDVPIGTIVDLLLTGRLYQETAGYAQIAINAVLLNSLAELVEKAGKFLSEAARETLATKKAGEWWDALQKSLNERLQEEEAAKAAYKEAQMQQEAK